MNHLCIFPLFDSVRDFPDPALSVTGAIHCMHLVGISNAH